MAYKIRPGIIRVKICDADLLVASRPVWESCPRVRQIPRTWAACWAIMEQDPDNKTEQDVIRAFSSLLKKQPEEIARRFDKMFQTLSAEGYLIQTDEDRT